MIAEVLKEFEKVKIGFHTIELWKLKERIRNGEDTLGIEHRELDTISNEQLGDYLLELASSMESEKEHRFGKKQRCGPVCRPCLADRQAWTGRQDTRGNA